MNDERLSEYKYLWDGSNRGWVLIKAPDLPGGYTVFNKEGQTLLHIESAAIKEGICARMRESSCEILEKLPTPLADVRPRPLK